MNEESFIFALFDGLPRGGPGSAESTAKALNSIPPEWSRENILDIGCGPGAQTIELARLGGGNVIAADIYAPFLSALETRAENHGVSDTITTVNASMFELNFPDGSFDILWTEGAIYIMGFGEALSDWRRLLKPGGYIAVTEITWLKDEIPDEPRRFWRNGYPGMKSIAENIAAAESSGFECVVHFTLPESDWHENYYTPLKRRIDMMREGYAGVPEAIAALDESIAEIELYKKFSEYYGYEFYIMRKN